jgi:hypothetical protein
MTLWVSTPICGEAPSRRFQAQKRAASVANARPAKLLVGRPLACVLSSAAWWSRVWPTCFHYLIASSQSDFVTDGHPASSCRGSSGAHDLIYVTGWQLLLCPCGALPSLTRWWPTKSYKWDTNLWKLSERKAVTENKGRRTSICHKGQQVSYRVV